MKKIIILSVLIISSLFTTAQQFTAYPKTKDIRVAVCNNTQASFDSVITYLQLDTIQNCWMWNVLSKIKLYRVINQF